MTDTQFQAEKRYQVALAMARTLLDKGLLTRNEYAAIDAILLDKFRPSLGALLSDSALT
ncbi:MAG: SHOCT domain-containing protein [Christensenellales bacterium]